MIRPPGDAAKALESANWNLVGACQCFIAKQVVYAKDMKAVMAAVAVVKIAEKDRTAAAGGEAAHVHAAQNILDKALQDKAVAESQKEASQVKYEAAEYEKDLRQAIVQRLEQQFPFI